jgi:hypothetical protein
MNVSQSAEKSGDEPLVQPSKFGKRLGRTIAVVFILFAILVAVDTFSGGG